MDYKLTENQNGTFDIVTFYGMSLTTRRIELTKEQAESALEMVRMAHSHGVFNAKEELRRWLGVPHG